MTTLCTLRNDLVGFGIGDSLDSKNGLLWGISNCLHSEISSIFELFDVCSLNATFLREFEKKVGQLLRTRFACKDSLESEHRNHEGLPRVSQLCVRQQRGRGTGGREGKKECRG